MLRPLLAPLLRCRVVSFAQVCSMQRVRKKRESDANQQSKAAATRCARGRQQAPLGSASSRQKKYPSATPQRLFSLPAMSVHAHSTTVSSVTFEHIASTEPLRAFAMVSEASVAVAAGDATAAGAPPQKPKNSTSGAAAQTVAASAKKRGAYTRQSCERCRSLHEKCDAGNGCNGSDGGPCRRCTAAGVECVRRQERKKRVATRTKQRQRQDAEHQALAQQYRQAIAAATYTGVMIVNMPRRQPSALHFTFSCKSLSGFFASVVRPHLVIRGGERFTVASRTYRSADEMNEQKVTEVLDWAAISDSIGNGECQQ